MNGGNEKDVERIKEEYFFKLVYGSHMIPIHVASIFSKRYLFLHKNEGLFQWIEVNHKLEAEKESSVIASSLSQAFFDGYKAYKEHYFRLVHCGFRYTLPERDVVGSNALFCQMALSYHSFNGRYFDEELGHFCYVDFASQEALEIWRKIRPIKP